MEMEKKKRSKIPLGNVGLTANSIQLFQIIIALIRLYSSSSSSSSFSSSFLLLLLFLPPASQYRKPVVEFRAGRNLPSAVNQLRPSPLRASPRRANQEAPSGSVTSTRPIRVCVFLRQLRRRSPYPHPPALPPPSPRSPWGLPGASRSSWPPPCRRSRRPTGEEEIFLNSRES